MSDPEYGETWTYESIVGALPGIDVSTRLAVAIQVVVFEGTVIGLAAIYGLWRAVPAATVAILVAAAGSIEMVRISRVVREEAVPESYRRLLFGSSIEVVLAVLAYVALVTHLFVFGPRYADVPLLERLLGPDPPVVAVYLLLLVLWDVCYRIGTGWWASVAALWRSIHFEFDPETAARLRRADLETMGFGLLQLALLPALVDAPVLAIAVAGHVVAVTLVTGVSVLLLGRPD
ncbi:MAG: hypothetical protein ABEI77_10030 [Halorientalis sp.]